MNLLVGYIRLVLRHSKLLFAVSAAIVAASAWAAAGIGFEFSLEALFQSDSPELARYREFTRKFGEENRVVFIAYKTPDAFEPADRAAVDRLSERLRALPAVKRVFGLPDLVRFAEAQARRLRVPGAYDAEVLRRDLTSSATARGFLCSADGTAACLVVELDDAVAGANPEAAVTALREELVAARETTGIHYHLAGVPIIEVEYGRMIRHDFFTIVPASVVLVLLLVALYFRNLTGTALLMASVFSSILCTLAVLRLLGIPIGILTNMVPTLILVVGLSESIHVLSHYQEALGEHGQAREAVARTVFYMAGACFLTSLTNALGFGSMMVSQMHLMREFGYTTALGILLSYLAAVILLPTMLDLVPASRVRGAFGAEIGSLVSGRLIRAVGWVNEHGRRWSFAAIAVLIAVSVWGMTRVHVRASWLEDIKEESEIWQAHAFLERNLSSVFSTEFWLRTDGLENVDTLRALERFERSLAEAKGFHHRISYVGSLVGMIKDAHANLAREEHLVRTFGAQLLAPGPELAARVKREMLAFDMEPHRVLPADAARLKLVREFLEKRSPDSGWLARTVDSEWMETRITARMMTDSRELGRFVDYVLAPPEPPIRSIEPTGKSYMAKAVLDTTIGGSLWSTGQLAVALWIMFAVIFRSWRMGWMAMVPNLIPPLVTAGIMGHCGIDLNYSTVTTFGVTLGLTVENTVQYMMRYRVEVLRDGDHTAAMYRALEAAGKPMIFSNMILIAGFSVGMLSTSKLTQNFGFLGALSISAATLADVFVTAALPLVFKPNIARWQVPEEKLRKVHDRILALLGIAPPPPGPGAGARD